MTNETPLVVFALSDKSGHYWIYAAIAIASMLQNSSVSPRIVILHDGTLSDEAMTRLSKITKDHRCALKLLKIDPGKKLKLPTFGRFSVATAYRLLIPQLFPNEKLVIYLDADLVLHGVDIAELHRSASAHEYPIMAVQDRHISKASGNLKLLNQLGVTEQGYFNSGVLAMRPMLLQSQPNLFVEFLNWIAKNPQTPHPDQDFLNVRFKNQWGALDDRFNYHVTVYDRQLLLPIDAYNGKILHYAGVIKPLDGSLGPGCLPFLSYASHVPEWTQALKGKRLVYVYPTDDPHTVMCQRLPQITCQNGAPVE